MNKAMQTLRHKLMLECVDMTRPVRSLSLQEVAACHAEGQDVLPGFTSALEALPQGKQAGPVSGLLEFES